MQVLGLCPDLWDTPTKSPLPNRPPPHVSSSPRVGNRNLSRNQAGVRAPEGPQPPPLSEAEEGRASRVEAGGVAVDTGNTLRVGALTSLVKQIPVAASGVVGDVTSLLLGVLGALCSQAARNWSRQVGRPLCRVIMVAVERVSVHPKVA
jgi:hypothetical protein